MGILASVAAVLAHGYFTRIDLPEHARRLALHTQILQGEAPAPYRFRVLVPWVCEAIARVAEPGLGARDAFLLAYGLFDLAALLLTLLGLLAFLRLWFPRAPALVGTLFAAATMPVALRHHYYQPWSLLEPALFAWGLTFMACGGHGRLAALVALASLNRETAVFLPLAFLLTSASWRHTPAPAVPGRWITTAWFLGYVGLWAAITAGLHAWRGHGATLPAGRELLAANLAPGALRAAFLNAGLFLGFFWVFAVLGLRHAPPFVRRAAWIVPIYAGAVLAWGIWYEVRLLMPLYPILIASGLAFVFRDERRALPAAAGGG